MRLYLIFLLGIFCSPAISQSVQNVKATFLDGKVTIQYDLAGNATGQKYQIEVYGSHNNYLTPLRLLTGDVGKDLIAGNSKKIEWDALNELETFSNNIIFKISGTVTFSPLSFASPVARASLRRGKSTTISWAGGVKGQPMKLELIQGTKAVQTIGDTGNSGTFNWGIPKNIKKGSYAIRITSAQETKESSVFLVKAKVPFILKLLPVLGLGGVAAVLLGGSSSGGNDDLPAAPGPK